MSEVIKRREKPAFVMWEHHAQLIEELEQSRQRCRELDRKSTRLNSSHLKLSRMPSSA